eukprot:6605742-Ditylum_brightwellii.AAC.1
MEGNIISYTGTVTMITADVTTARLLFNSVLSTPTAKYLGINIKDFYLNTNLNNLEYMNFPTELIPQEVVEQYNLQDLEHKGY